MIGFCIQETEPNILLGLTSRRKNNKLNTIVRATCSIQMSLNLRRKTMKASTVSNIIQMKKSIPLQTKMPKSNTSQGRSTAGIKINLKSKNLI